MPSINHENWLSEAAVEVVPLRRSSSSERSEENEALLSDERHNSKEKSKNSDNSNRNKFRLGIRNRISKRAATKRSKIICALALPFLLLLLYVPIYNNIQKRSEPIVGWDLDVSRNVADYVLKNHNESTTLLEPHNLFTNKLFLLIVVFSGVDNFETRDNIRKTWGNTTEFNYGMFEKIHAGLEGQYLMPSVNRLKHYSEFLQLNKSLINEQTKIPSILPVRVVFLIGRKHLGETDVSTVDMLNDDLDRLAKEAETYNDIVQENFIDSYNNLTLKSVFALKWVSSRCQSDRCAYFLKCDDDTFVNVPNLLHYLLGGLIPIYNDTLKFFDKQSIKVLSPQNRLNDTEKLLMGHLFCGAHPIANAREKWYMPAYMYPGDIYPAYLSGEGYMMSIDVVPKLYATALNTSLVYLEDLYITGICAQKIRLHRRHHHLFSLYASGCEFKGLIIAHQLKGNLLLDAYELAVNLSIKCPPPGKHLFSLRLAKTGRYCN